MQNILREIIKRWHRFWQPPHALFRERQMGRLRLHDEVVDKSAIRLRSWLKRFFWHWYVPLIGSVVLAAFLFIYASITYISFARDLTTSENIMNRNNRGLILYDKDNSPFYRGADAREYHTVPLESIPEIVREATLAAEDAQFYEHPGFSYRAIVRSLLRDILEHSLTRYGGSTITQQLVKNSLVGQEQTLNRKFKELVLAIEIERRYPKDKILEMYLNSVYYGSNAYGIAEAAQVYFGKDIGRLNLSEASLLAALPNAPSYLSPHAGNLEAAKKRQAYVLSQMLVHSFINETEAEAAKQASLTIIPRKKETVGTSPHFALYVLDRVYELFDEDEVNRRGFRIYTTLDSNLEKISEEEIARRVKALRASKASNGALVALDPKTGAILAMVGSADWNNDSIGGKFNASVLANRQPGSSIKPLIYLQAFADRLVTPTSILHDRPTDFGGGYHPKNYDGAFRGDVTVRRALANSLNVPSVELLRMVRVEKAITTALHLGITTFIDPSRYGLSLILGGGEVKLIELTGAYGILANNGLKAETHAIVRIEDKFGQTVYSHEYGKIGLLPSLTPRQLTHEVIDPAPAYLVTNILSDNEARSEVFGSALRISRPAAVKTGTTDDYRDSWTIGYTPQLVVGVWVGNSDNTPMTGVAGSLGAAPIWQAVMERGLVGKPVQQFIEPAGVSGVKVCPDKYLLDENGVSEVFLSGTEPTELCHPIPSPTPTPSPEVIPEPYQSVTQEPAPSP